MRRPVLRAKDGRNVSNNDAQHLDRDCLLLIYLIGLHNFIISYQTGM